jgi:hypothetical protein
LKRVENGVPFCSIKLHDSVVIFTRLFVRRACVGGWCKTRVAQLCDEDCPVFSGLRASPEGKVTDGNRVSQTALTSFLLHQVTHLGIGGILQHKQNPLVGGPGLT